MKDSNLVYVDDEVRRLMREFGDLIFDEADQEMIDSKYREYMVMKNKQREGIRYVLRF